MKILVVGGTGLVGGWSAIDLERQGHEVTILARRPPPQYSLMAGMSFLQASYFDDDINSDIFAGFDAMIFAACSDIRHAPGDQELAGFYQRANIEGVPAFLEKVQLGGIKRVVYIGTLYASLRPELAAVDPYVESRIVVDQAIRAMASADFHIVTIDIPYALGGLTGLLPMVFQPIAEWALGRRPEVPLFAPGGGSNFMSLRSIAQALQAAVTSKGENGRAYLIGDENLSFQDLCKMFFRAAGREVELPILEDEHPLLPDAILPAGRGGWLRFEPDNAEIFGYRRHDVGNAVEDIVRLCRSELGCSRS